MRTFVYIAFFSLLGFNAGAQDLIVTQDKDSIICKIQRLDESNIYYAIRQGSLFQNKMLALKDVKDYRYDFYKNWEGEKTLIPPSKKVFPKLRLGLDAGFAFRMWKEEDSGIEEVNDYFQALRSGWYLRADAQYFLSGRSGIGINFAQFSSNNSITLYAEDQNGDIVELRMSDKIKVTYLGPTYTLRLFTNTRDYSAFLISLGGGYLAYRKQGSFLTKL